MSQLERVLTIIAAALIVLGLCSTVIGWGFQNWLK